MANKHKQKRFLQLSLLGLIILISFSFLFVYVRSEDEKTPIGISSIENPLHLESKHKDTEKKASKEDTGKGKKEETKSEQTVEAPEPKPTEETQKKEPETNKSESIKEEAPVKQPEIQTVTFSIDMKNILDHKGEVNPRFQAFIPEDGVLFAPINIEIQEGDTVYDILTRVCEQQSIPLDASSGYVKYINNIGEFDAGKSSGWLYKVNGTLYSKASTQYKVKAGDVIEWRYTVKVGDI